VYQVVFIYKRHLVSTYLYVRPHETTQLSLDRFSGKLMFEYFSKICR